MREIVWITCTAETRMQDRAVYNKTLMYSAHARPVRTIPRPKFKIFRIALRPSPMRTQQTLPSHEILYDIMLR